MVDDGEEDEGVNGAVERRGKLGQIGKEEGGERKRGWTDTEVPDRAVIWVMGEEEVGESRKEEGRRGWVS